MMAFGKSFATFLVLGTLVSCIELDSTKKKGTRSIDTNQIIGNKSLSSSEKAEKIALAAEQLATPTGFMYADLLADQALSIDPANKRAQLYKAILATPMTLKGILTRIKPLIEQYPAESTEEYNKFIANLPNSGLRTFLFDGKENIRSEKDIQAFIDEYYNAQDKLRLFLKNNKDLELTLNLNDWTALSSLKKTVEDCAVEQVGNGTFEINECNMTKAMQVELNRADIETIQHMIAGSQIYTSLLTAYSASGTFAVSKDAKGQNLTKAQIWKKLTLDQDFGVLRNAQVLKNIPEFGADALLGIRFAMSMQSELCPSGRIQNNARKGYLFHKGICIAEVNEDGSRLEDVLQLIDIALSGQSMEMTLHRNQEIKTVTQPIAVLENPIADLKELRPVFNDCDRVAAVADDSLGGTLPNREGNELLLQAAECDVE